MAKGSAQRLVELATQLAEALMTAAICANEIRNEALSTQAERPAKSLGLAAEPSLTSAGRRPLLDQSTFSVRWQGKSVYLGHTRVFWLLDRIARRPNQYVTHLDLLHDVWDDEELATATIRSAVRHLRARLRSGGMGDLAVAIHGHNGRYILTV